MGIRQGISLRSYWLTQWPQQAAIFPPNFPPFTSHFQLSTRNYPYDYPRIYYPGSLQSGG